MYIGKAVKMELEDPLEEVYAPLHKRSKHSPPQKQQSLGYNPLDEPSPLGLRLRKSPSLLELIQMKLSESSSTKENGKHGKKNQKSSGADEKLKASNFPASILKIGTWEYKSRYEGDLVAKCYFAKHKLVWEVLDGGLKNKIEIQWSDIMALKATYPDDGPGTLDVVLIRPPLFYRETNPQPRKHTLWQATSDFTNGQASIHRRHYMQCPQGLLGKHFEKLVQCDPRLNFLSKQPEITIESLYFEPRIPVFEESNEINNNFEVNNLESPISFNLLNTNSASRAQSSSSKSEQDPISRSPSSVMDSGGMEESQGWKNKSKWENIVVPGLPTSMSMSDLVSHLEERISHHGNGTSLSNEERQSLDILEDISRCLFSETQNMNTPVSDEKSLMSRVNSLCSLLNKDPVSENKVEMNYQDDVSVSCRNKKNSSMSRIDSVGELLLNLPRIASLPRFLFNIGD